MKKAMFYDKLENKKVQCKLCPHNCIIKENNKGICGVRQNLDSELYSLVYDKLDTMHIDPIEKKPLYHFFPGEKAMSIATMGCNFSCKFCQNANLSQSPKQNIIRGGNIPPEEIVKKTQNQNCKIIAYTYSEPTIFFELAYDTAKIANKNNIKNVFVTNGYINPKPLEKISPYLDAANIDLKCFSEEFYKKTCGGKLQPVLDSIKNYYKLGIWIEITTLLIPEQNDSPDEIKKIAEFIASIDKNIPWHISRFHPDYKMYDSKVTPIEKLRKAYEIGKKVGLNYIYLGNVPGDEHDNTYCSNCNKLLIKRSGFWISKNNLKKNQCKFCGEEVKGRF
jgi:pyruvate formate lyase activating enzyme